MIRRIKKVRMAHAIFQVTSFRIEAAYAVRVAFNDNSEQIVDFDPVLKTEN